MKNIYVILTFLILISCGDKKILPPVSSKDWPKFDTEKRAEVQKNAEKVEEINLAYAKDIPSGKSLEDMINTNNINNPSSANKFSSQTHKLHHDFNEIELELKVVKEKLDVVKKKINPEVLKIRADSLYEAIIDSRNLRGRKITEKQMNEIINEIKQNNDKYVNKINNQLIGINEEQITLVNKYNTYAFMILALNENKDIQCINLSAETTGYFELGSNTLTDEILKITLKELTDVLTSMTTKIEELKRKKRLTKNLTAKVFFTIDGYSDSTPYPEDSTNKNKILSQERADYIALQLSNLTEEYFSTYKTDFITFVKPEILSIGHGEENPYPDIEYTENDPRRRITKVSWYFEFE